MVGGWGLEAGPLAFVGEEGAAKLTPL